MIDFYRYLGHEPILLIAEYLLTATRLTSEQALLTLVYYLKASATSLSANLPTDLPRLRFELSMAVPLKLALPLSLNWFVAC